MWSRALALACGFWSISAGKVMAAFMAMASNVDSAAKASKGKLVRDKVLAAGPR